MTMYDPANFQHDIYHGRHERTAHRSSIAVTAELLSPSQLHCIRNDLFPIANQSHEHPTLAALEIRCLTAFKRGSNGRGTWSLTLFGEEVRAHLNRRAA